MLSYADRSPMYSRIGQDIIKLDRELRAGRVTADHVASRLLTTGDSIRDSWFGSFGQFARAGRIAVFANEIHTDPARLVDISDDGMAYVEGELLANPLVTEVSTRLPRERMRVGYEGLAIVAQVAIREAGESHLVSVPVGAVGREPATISRIQD